MPCTPQWSCFAWLFSYSQEYDLCPIPCSLAHLRCPIANKQYSSNPKFRHFRRQLYHSSLARILQSLKPGMTKPTVARCPDGHFQLVIYGLGPLIADYPEQVLIACIVQGWCPKWVILLFFIWLFSVDINLDVLCRSIILVIWVWDAVANIRRPWLKH